MQENRKAILKQITERLFKTTWLIAWCASVMVICGSCGLVFQSPGGWICGVIGITPIVLGIGEYIITGKPYDHVAVLQKWTGTE